MNNFELKYKEFLFQKYIQSQETIPFINNRYKQRNLIEKEVVESIIEKNKNTSFSIRNIYEQYNENYGPLNFSKETLYKFMKEDMHYKYVTIKEKNKNFFTRKNKNIRKVLVQKLNELIAEDELIIFSDETTFNNKSYAIKTWRNPSQKSLFPVGCNKKRLNLILATSKDEIIYYKYYQKNTNTNVVVDFYNEVLKKLKRHEKYSNLLSQRKITFYLDNATYHHGNKLKEFFFLNNLKILYGAPYSCEFNMCEFIFSHLKNLYYKRIFSSM